MRQKKNSFSMSFFAMGIATLFIGGFLLLVVFGAVSYSNMMRSEQANADFRRINAYLNTSLTADRCGTVRVDRDTRFGDVLVAEDSDTGYAFRIYCRDGKLVEDYGESHGELIPEDALEIGDTSTFSVDFTEDGLMLVTTDMGTVRVTGYGREVRGIG